MSSVRSLIPWAKEPTALVIHDCMSFDGTPAELAPSWMPYCDVSAKLTQRLPPHAVFAYHVGSAYLSRGHQVMALEPFLRFLHLAGVAVWIGGMFFAYVCLRPVAGQLLEPPQRLRLWRGVFARFFVAVWAAVILIPVSGLAMLARAGFAAAPINWHLMLLLGLVMVAIFLYVYTVPYAALQKAVDAEDWPAGGAALNRIRQAVAANLHLGFLTIAVATLGRWLA